MEQRQLYNENWDFWLDMKVHGPASRWLRGLIDDCLAIVPQERVRHILDIGCGEGTNTVLLSGRFPHAQVTGIDFSIAAIAAANRRYRLSNLCFVHDDDSSLLDSDFDMVTCFEVLEHVKNWRHLLHRMGRSSNRYLLISSPTGRMRAFETNIGHVRNFRKGEVEGFLARSGFRPLKVFYAGFPFYSPLYREICNMTNAASTPFTRGRYGAPQKLVSLVVRFFFRYLSTKRRLGDQFVGLFTKTQPE